MTKDTARKTSNGDIIPLQKDFYHSSTIRKLKIVNKELKMDIKSMTNAEKWKISRKNDMIKQQ